MRKFGVEEELLLVDAATLRPSPLGEQAVVLHHGITSSGSGLATELKQEQIESVCPPQTTLEGQLQAIRSGRAAADAAAQAAGGRAVALATSPVAAASHFTSSARFAMIADRFGMTAKEQLTNGFHVHVEVSSICEAVAALDQIRVWLPTLLALSANSPFWQGADTGFASYRYQAWSRWPTSGPTEFFGADTGYLNYRQSLLDTMVPLDQAMIYSDARICEHQSTLEVRIADVCLEAEHAAVLAAIIRALVETAARDPQIHPPGIPSSLLRVWSWEASRSGMEGKLIHPRSGTPAPAAEVARALLEQLEPVFEDYGDLDQVRFEVARILRDGSGARAQRQAFASRGRIPDIVAMAIDRTHAGAAEAAASPLSVGRAPAPD
ncbi:carboxylate-amine ligase [Glutamicibacter arilaitensis]|uniref:carboxylate-amine ligase n=1 Tax=Glutamicibacter arilaitensis TaxID=256701 RepID=UPI000EC633B8|nr:carboxylate--amine ligase [Glutamicibacter sp.]